MSATASVYLSPQSDLVVRWDGLDVAHDADPSTLRVLACATLESTIDEMVTAHGCEALVAGLSAVSVIARRTPPKLADPVTRMMLLNRAYVTAVEFTSRQPH